MNAYRLMFVVMAAIYFLIAAVNLVMGVKLGAVVGSVGMLWCAAGIYISDRYLS